MEDKWISDFKFENHQFHAKQNDEWLCVKNLEVVEFLKTPEIPDVPEEEIAGWDVVEDEDKVEENLEKLRLHFRSKANDDWWPSLRRPSEITLEPLYQEETVQASTSRQPSELEQPVESKKNLNVTTHQVITNQTTETWVSKLDSCHDAVTMGLSLNEF